MRASAACRATCCWHSRRNLKLKPCATGKTGDKIAGPTPMWHYSKLVVPSPSLRFRSRKIHLAKRSLVVGKPGGVQDLNARGMVAIERSVGGGTSRGLGIRE